MRGWDRAKEEKAAASMEEAVRAVYESGEAAQEVDGDAGAGGQTGFPARGSIEAGVTWSGARVLMDRIASRTSKDEDLRQAGDKEGIPSYSESLQELEVREGDIDRKLSETRQALSQTERSIARLDASAGRGEPGGTVQSRLDSNVQGRESLGLGGEIVNQADEAAKEYLEFLAMRRDLRLKETVFEYRRKRGAPASEEDERA